ncbi:MAG: co-chaperone GroES [Desulfobacca sp. 4484_104]|nr:MAG: co-chaperone GroES [Desulfobacca sp. 4484_104]RLA90982.1 MAG: co-chaperone GroES [Deltaproteobacteria bacterium]
MKVKPLNDRVLVKRLEETQMTKGGIYIPDTAKEKPIEGRIMAVGAGKMSDKGERLPLTVKEGDRVLFGKYAGTEIKLEGEDYLMMREEDILAIIEE